MSDKNETEATVDAFIETLPSGIKTEVGFMKDIQTGLLKPLVAIRVWREQSSLTDDGRSIRSSGSYWDCVAIVGSRQEAGYITNAIWKTYHQRSEVWYLEAFNNAKGPHIIDHSPWLNGLFSDRSERDKIVLNGPKVWNEDVTEEILRKFAYDWTLFYYGIHPSNYQYVKVESVKKYEQHHAIWLCSVKFSVNNDGVVLWIHPTDNGLEVFQTDYSQEKANDGEEFPEID